MIIGLSEIINISFLFPKNFNSDFQFLNFQRKYYLWEINNTTTVEKDYSQA